MKNKNCLIWVFLCWNYIKLLHCGVLHQHPQVFPNTKFRPKIKILIRCKVSSKSKKTLNLGPKTPSFSYFWDAV